jgi:tRNA_anti-like
VSSNLKNKRLYFFAVALVTIAPLSIYGYKEFTRKPADLTKSDAAESLAASDLCALYSNYEDSANKKYLGKIIEVTGSIVEIENQQDTLLTILLGDTLHPGRVSCLIDKKKIAAAKNSVLGDAIKLKGICTGYLMDVELNRCVIVKK